MGKIERGMSMRFQKIELERIANLFGVNPDKLCSAQLHIPENDLITVTLEIAPDSNEIAQILVISQAGGAKVDR